MEELISLEVSRSIMMSLSVFVGSLLIGWLVRRSLLLWLRKWAAKTETTVDDLILSSVKGPSGLWVILLSIRVTLRTSHLGPAFIDYGSKIISVLLVLSITVLIANVLSNFFLQRTRSLQTPLPVTGISQVIVKATVYLLGGLVLLSELGISITPMITALGIGGLAVALALQDTLSNFFSGLHIVVENPIRVGDYIRLSSGEEGYVVDIGWRTTRIRMLPNNMVIIPNQKLAQSIITNYYLPEKKMGISVQIGVSYDCDPDRVEEILTEEAVKGAKEIPGFLPDPPPSARLIPGFGDSALNFSVNCQVAEFTDQFLVQHEMRKRILKRFKKEGIEIPFPTRTVYLKERPPSGNGAPAVEGKKAREE
jgi:small-conductance mechanosensitive channel